jgi:translation elongation factor EF-4
MKDGSARFINSAADFPEHTDINVLKHIESIQEPVIEASILSPDQYAGDIMTLCAGYRGVQTSFSYIEGDAATDIQTKRVKLVYRLPLSSIVTTFHSALKSLSSGYASLDYENAGYEASDLVKLNIMVNGRAVDALTAVVHRSHSVQEGKDTLAKLRSVVARQQFEIVFQAAVGSKIVARERIAPTRKDVTAGLYGGHFERVRPVAC